MSADKQLDYKKVLTDKDIEKLKVEFEELKKMLKEQLDKTN